MAPTKESTEVRDRKANGVYYTPPRLAGLLADWALERDPRRILEPSFGQGVFLRALDKRLRRLGVKRPARRLYGIELNPSAATGLAEDGIQLPEDHLRTGDLLSFDGGTFGGPFGAIVGNPPYIRHHLLDEDLVTRGRRSAELLGISLNGRTDAWAYFCAHLVTFLAADGRLALVLPGSVLQADYAKPLLDALAKERGQVQLIRIGERLFPGVQERTVILLIDRARPTRGQVIYRSIANLDGLRSALKRPPKRTFRSAKDLDVDRVHLPWRLSKKEAGIWETVNALPTVSTLGDLAKVRIGVVTGANSFFVRPIEEAESLGRRVASLPIVSRGGWLRSPRWSSEDQARVEQKPSRLLLFPADVRGISARAKAEIEAAESRGLHLRHHCANRTPWYSISDTKVPDLFLPYMASAPPRLTVNEAGATSTNTVHRVWLEGAGATAEELAAASWTTLYRLSAELAGRAYGGGVLKLEPTGATALRIAGGAPAEFLEEIEDLAADDPGRARQLADQRLLVDGLGLSVEEVEVFARAADRMAQLRGR
jgi:adenine-specific DNA-methyltransferase